MRRVLADLGANVAADDWHRVLLDGDRAFLYTHVRLEGEATGGGVRRYATQAMRIARRQNKGFDAVDDDEELVAGGHFGVSEALRYTCALEGICVLQADGRNREHAGNVDVIRKRHFTLAYFALLYRFALLDITILGVTNRGLTRDQELRRIERLNGRVEHFTHWLYHGNISNMTHLQALFDFFQRQLHVPRLWEDVQRDLPRHMDRLEQIEKRKLARRRGWIDVLGAIVAATIVIKEVSELLGQFKIDLPAWFFEATGTHRAGVLLLLLLGVGLAGGGRLVLGHLHDKVAPID